MMKNKKTAVRLLDFLALLTFIATFSPLVIPQHLMEPFLMGIPYTFWMGFLVSLFFVLLTYLVSLTQKEENNVD